MKNLMIYVISAFKVPCEHLKAFKLALEIEERKRAKIPEQVKGQK